MGKSFSYGHSVKRGVGAYTDSKPGLSRDRSVDQNGNPLGAFSRSNPQLGERLNPYSENIYPCVEASKQGFAGKLPRK